MTFSFPLALGTIYFLIFAGLSCILFVISTHYEDKTLTLELEGYKEFKEKLNIDLFLLYGSVSKWVIK